MASALEKPPVLSPSGAGGDNQFRFVWNVLNEHWLMILVGVLVGVSLFGGVAFVRMEVTPQQYRAEADLVVLRSQWEKDIFREVGGVSLFPVRAKDLAERASTRAISEEVARALVQRDVAEGGMLSRIATDQGLSALASELESKIRIQPLDDTQKIRIAIEACATLEEASDIAEFTSRVFLEQHREYQLEEGKETHEFIEKELEDRRRQLFDAETAEWDFKRKAGFQNFGKLDQEMTGMYNELAEAKADMEVLRGKLEGLDAELADNSVLLPATLGQVTDTAVESLYKELDDLIQQQLSMAAIYQPAHPKYQTLQDEIDEKSAAILEGIRQLDASEAGGSGAWFQRQQIYREKVELRMQLSSLEVREASLERRLEEMIPQIPELANRNLEYQQLVEETQSIRDQFNRLREREWEVRTALGRGGGQIDRYEPVKASPLPVGVGGTGIGINMLIGALTGFVAAFCIAMMMEANDTSIRSMEDVHDYIGIEVIGTIPEMRFGKPRGSRRRRATYVASTDEDQIDSCIVTQHDPKSPISEAYRTLRTNFQFATIKQHPRTVMITSAVPGEGKTTTAANMAVTLADQGLRVLLVDTDMRRPNVHRVLRMERGMGLADVLRNEMDYKDAIRATQVKNLWVISSGRVPANPSELLGSDTMAELMKRLGQDFDIVLCDAPSVLVVTDPVLLATHVDSCVMVVSTKYARRETVMRAHKLLQSAMVSVAGVVVNGLETTRRHYYYYYYYYDEGAASRKKWYHFL